MASTVHVDFSEPKVNAAWLNDVNAMVYDVLGTLATPDAVRSQLGLGAASPPATGDILVGDGVGFNNTQLVAGTNVTITPGVGTLIFSAISSGYSTEAAYFNGDVAPIPALTLVRSGSLPDQILPSEVAAQAGAFRNIGFAKNAINIGTDGIVVTSGTITGTTTEWDVITEDVGGLVPGSQYFVGEFNYGHITQYAPTIIGSTRQSVGIAMSPTTMEINIGPAELITTAKQATLQFRDEGTNLGSTGTVTAVNFVGTGITATRSSNTITVSVSAGSTQTINIGTWDLSLGNITTLNLTSNITMAAPTNIAPGAYALIVNQDATGSRLVTWNAIYDWPGGTAPTLSTAANAKDIISFLSDGTRMYGVAQKAFT